MSVAKVIGVSIIALVFLSVVSVVLWGHCTVPAGNVAVQYDQFRGGVLEEEFGEGLHIMYPWIDTVEMSVREEAYTMSADADSGDKLGHDAIQILSSEGLPVDLDITVRFKIISSSASNIYRNIGPDYVNVLIRPTIEDTIRGVASTHTAAEIYGEQRTQVEAEMYVEMSEALLKSGFTVVEVQLKQVTLPDQLTHSIENKMVADQEAQRMEFVKEKEQLEADRRVIEATGIADAEVAEALGHAEAIRVIDAELSPRYNQYVYYTALFNSNNKTVVIPADSNMILNGVTA